MNSLFAFDAALRLLAIGQLLLFGVVIARSGARPAMRLTIGLLLVSVAGYLVTASPLLPIWPPTLFAAQFVPFLLWLAAHLLFDRPILREAAALAALMIAICAATFVMAELGQHPAPLWAAIIQHLLSLALLIHAIAFAWRDRDNDLVEKRRRFRIGFVLIVGLQALAIVVVEMLHRFSPVTPELVLAQSATALVAVFGFGAFMMKTDADLWFDEAPASVPGPLSPTEHVLNEKLEALMAAGVYREPGLTIGALAGRLQVPEHRLRSLINRRLGYRNFSDFLNRRRIADAKALLADPDHVDLPVLTIAMDLGYGSLPPFNRAFREATSQTPTDYRRAAILGQ